MQSKAAKIFAQDTPVPSFAITPGTPFMQEVTKAVEYYVCSRLQLERFKHLCIEVSGPTVKVGKN